MPKLQLRRWFLVLGIGLAILYWLIESVADSWFGGEGPIATRLLPAADANEIWMRLIIVILILTFTGYVSVAVSRRERAERKLRMLESAVEHTDDAILVTTVELDPPGPEIVYVNEAFCGLYGYATEELLGQTPRILQGPDSEREVLDQLRKCLECEESFVGTLTNYRKDGSSFLVELRISPVYNSAGELTHWVSILQDITERELTQRAIRESEARKAAIMEAALDCIITMDYTGVITDFNPAAERTFGYRRDEVLGRELAEVVVPPTLRDAHRRGLARYLATGEGPVLNRRVELPGMRAKGAEFPVELSVVPIHVDGHPEFTAYLRDITERKRAEEELRRTEEKYHSIFDNAVEGIFQTSVEGKVILANPAAARLLGYESPEDLVANVYDLGSQHYANSADRVEFYTLMQQCGAVSNFEIQMRRRDGALIWCSVSARLLHDDEGELLGSEGMIVDVTERKRSEEVRARLAAIVENSDDAILSETLDGIITTWNNGAQKLFGYTAEEAIGQPIYMLAPPDRRDEPFEILAKIRRGESTRNRETVRLAKDSRPIDVSLTVSPVKDSEENIIGASWIARDVTERKQSENALREVREAERRQVARDIHDGPLQELMDCLYAMQLTRLKLRDERIDTPELDEQVETLRNATQDLRYAINNLRRESLQEQPFLRLLRSLVLANQQKIPHTEIDLDVDASFSSEPSGNMGIDLLRIIQEALVNVRRHSRARHVWVRLREEETFLIVEVVDDGRGFDWETVWGGIGLSSMQERAFKLGGDLEIQSAPGQGTRVTVRVPAESAFAVGALNLREFGE